MDPLAGINHGQLAIADLSAGERERGEAEAALSMARSWVSAQYISAMDLLAVENARAASRRCPGSWYPAGPTARDQRNGLGSATHWRIQPGSMPTGRPD